MFPTKQEGTECDALDEGGPEYAETVLRRVDPVRSDFNEGDLLFCCTRLPLDDSRQGNKVHIKKSYANLEKAIFREARAFFKKCAKDQIELTEEISRQFERGYNDYAKCLFATMLSKNERFQ